MAPPRCKEYLFSMRKRENSHTFPQNIKGNHWLWGLGLAKIEVGSRKKVSRSGCLFSF